MSDTTTGSAKALNAAGWQAAWYDEYKNKAIMVREAFVLSMINAAYRDNPQANSAEIAKAMVAFRQRYDREVLQGQTPLYQWGKNIDHYINTAFGVAEGFDFSAEIGLGVEVNPAKILGEVYKGLSTHPEVGTTIESWTGEWANEAQNEWVSKWIHQVPGILEEAVNSKNPLHKDAIDRAYVNSAIPSLKGVETENPVILLEPILIKLKPASAQKIRQGIKTNGSFSMSKDELRDILKEELGGIEGRLGTLETMMGETLETLKRIDAQQKDILAWIANEEQQKKEQALRQAEAQRHQLMIDGANSTVYLVSTLVGLSDPKLSKEIMVVGSSAIQVYDAIEKFVDALPELTKLGNLAVGLSAAVMTGNIVGAVMSIVPLFVDQGPTPEQMILEQIGKLQEQVGRMHQQMHDRFDRIEKFLDAIYGGINAIFDVLNTRFNQIQLDLAGLIRDVDLIQEELARQELHLSRLGMSVHKGLQDGFRHDFKTAFNTALGYRERNRVGMSLPQFSTWEGEFFTWAVDDAKNENEQPLAGRRYEDDFVLLELEDKPLEENIMYLSNWHHIRVGLPRLTTVPVANPITWGISAWAYNQLQIENPKYATTGSYPARKAMVDKEGEKLRSALRRITVKQDTATGPVPNYELFDWLIANYKKKAEEMDGALRAIESKYLNDHAKLPKVDPWGGAQQKIDHTLTLTADPTPPSNLATFLPNIYVLTDYIKLDDPGLSVSMAPEWTAERQEDVSLRDGWSITRVFAKLLVNVIVKYAGTSFLARHVVGDEEMKIMEFKYDSRGLLVSDWMLDIDTAFNKNWTTGQNLKGRFEAGQSQGAPATVVHDVVNRFETRLRELRAALYSWVLSELNDGQSLESPTRRLDGAKALVDRFVNLGMPIAVESNELLRAMLYGTQSLVDRRQIQERYHAAYIDAVPTGKNEQGSVNVRLPLRKDADARADALGQALKGHLQLIGEKKHAESQGMIESTLAKSRATSFLVKVLSTETRSPKVRSTAPANGATGVRRNVNLTAIFSEKMNKRTLNKSTFKLYKVNANGSTTQVTNVTVTPSTDGLKATLNPYGTSRTLLAKNTRYKAVITTGAKDLAGNALDQNPTKAGYQQKVWTFKTGSQ